MSKADKDFKVITDLYKNLSNISTTLSHFKDMLKILSDTTIKNTTDTQLIKDNICDLKQSINKINDIITDIEKAINMLNIQLDYKEKIIHKEIKTNFIKKIIELISLFFKNSKWLAYILIMIIILIAIFFSKEKIFDFVMNLIGAK